jgi:hypothetical protein
MRGAACSQRVGRRKSGELPACGRATAWFGSNGQVPGITNYTFFRTVLVCDFVWEFHLGVFFY